MPDRLVYSTDEGRLADACPRCRKNPCRCKPATGASGGRQVAHIQRSSRNRAGKTVTLVSGLCLPPEDLAALAAVLRKRCGTGGTVQDSVIELQGDQRESACVVLREMGYAVKRSGG